MDRFAWLRCQPWLLPWPACASQPLQRQCAACAQRKSKWCENLNWVFSGFASLHAICNQSMEQARGEAVFGPLSQDVAHLFFSACPPLSDPAQMLLTIGTTQKEPCRPVSSSCGIGSGGTVLLISFDESSPFALDFTQVEAISLWTREKGCSLCSHLLVAPSNEVDTNERNSCVCQQMPMHATVKLRHVALNIYSPVELEEALGTTKAILPVNELVEYLQLLFVEASSQMPINGKLQHVAAEVDAGKSVSQSMANSTELVNSSYLLFQQLLGRIDCICEGALKAVDVCSADHIWMAQLLLIMVQHSGNHNDMLTKLQSLYQHLHHHLKVTQDEEQKHIAKIWACLVPLGHQEARTLAASSLQSVIQQRRQLEEAILRLELISAVLSS